MKEKTVTDPGPRPSNAPRACGQFGVRAPVRYGRKLTPPQPGGSRSANSVSSWWLIEKAWQTCSNNWETDCGMRHVLENALKFSWNPTHISGRLSCRKHPARQVPLAEEPITAKASSQQLDNAPPARRRCSSGSSTAAATYRSRRRRAPQCHCGPTPGCPTRQTACLWMIYERQHSYY